MLWSSSPSPISHDALFLPLQLLTLSMSTQSGDISCALDTSAAPASHAYYAASLLCASTWGVVLTGVHFCSVSNNILFVVCCWFAHFTLHFFPSLNTAVSVIPILFTFKFRNHIWTLFTSEFHNQSPWFYNLHLASVSGSSSLAKRSITTQFKCVHSCRCTHTQTAHPSEFIIPGKSASLGL